MSVLNRNWPVTAGIVMGVLLGVVLSKTLDHWPPPASAEPKESHKIAIEQAAIFRSAAKTIAPSVVNITTLARVRISEGGGIGFDRLGMPFYRQPKIKEGLRPQSHGSGFVFDAANGYILTNNHVVADGESYVVRLSDKREVEAKLVGTDPQTDVAVLKIEQDRLTAASLGDSNAMEVGDWVLAVGNPFGLLEQTVTSGIISAKGRHGLGLTNYEDFLQTDAAINQGNSGGPLVNLNGEVVGINTAIFSRSGGYQGIGFAIPINQARKIVTKLVKSGAVVRGWMGVQVQGLSPEESRRLNLPDGGASVEGVFLRGQAKQAGLLPGDILLKIDGKPVRNGEDIREQVAEMEPGAQVQLLIRRNDETKALKMTVGEQPKDWGQASKSPVISE